MWATEGVQPQSAGESVPYMGKLAAIPDEPAFAGRVRMAPGAEASFDTGRVRSLDDDDDVLPARRGSRAGMLVLIMALLVMGAAATVVYVFVIRNGKEPAAVLPTRDAGVVATVTPDAAPIMTPVPVIDAAAVVTGSPLDAARGELAADVEPRLRTAILSLDGKDDAPAQALRAHLIAQLAQDLQDRASVTPDKAVADPLRKEARQLVLDAATAAQRALRTAGDDAGANLAMAEVLRLQGKPARDSKRYLDTAHAKADKDWARDLALADGLGLVHDGKLDDARAAFAAIDQGDGKLETSGDVRARFHLALVLAAQNKPADARPLVDAILAAQPEHAGAKALAAKLETQVAKGDPLPPEDGGDKPPGPVRPAGTGRVNPAGTESGGGGDSYDHLLKRANEIADTSCAKAMELYAKALEQKPNGVEALVGMGYCHIDAKQFASAFSKFRTALMVSSRYEPALRGIAEAYQQQGRKEQAIEAYKAYLEVYPDSSAAKKQLERLGGDTASPPPGAGSGPAAPPATPPTAPPPAAPTPATPEAPAQGSGSG
jgi:tetratricopeptide (TPR) repeat protein